MRRHDSVTIVIDTDQHRVIDVEPTREKGTVTAFAQKPERHGGSGDAVTAVSSDMSQSYLHGIAEHFSKLLG
ncbi:MAG TPA: transposase [Candidatus Treponema faecavium]|nr:transposase [Candidatus Treponema faecavium]